MTRPESLSDTITAIATPPGNGGVGVIRVSGSSLTQFAIELTGSCPKPRFAALSSFRSAAGETIDQGLLLYFSAPHSFTGEDVLEIQGHGGVVVLQLLLERCLELGARLAGPGEFTQRAFLNRKIDLIQAEAIADLINAQTKAAAQAAARSLRGDFSSELSKLESQILSLRVLVEAALDFPEETADPFQDGKITAALQEIQSMCRALLGASVHANLLKVGLHVVLVGRPNVGKSSLLNRLSAADTAIVSPYPGTTRDTVRASIQLEGFPIHLADTAGLRETSDSIEKMGITRTWAELEQADLVLWVLDIAQGWTAEDSNLLATLPKEIPKIVVWNKSDSVAIEEYPPLSKVGNADVIVSARTGEGLDDLKRRLLAHISSPMTCDLSFMARARHVEALRLVEKHITEGVHAISCDLLAENLGKAQEALAAMTGKEIGLDLLGEIFSSFCIGK